MYDSYKVDSIKKAYEELRTFEDRPKWVAEAGHSIQSMLDSFERNNIVYGHEAVDIMRETLNKVKKYIPDKSSSMDMFDALMSGKYDSKIAIYRCDDKGFINNCVESYIINGKLYMIQVITDEQFDRKSPTQYTKKLDWIFENFEHIFVRLVDME